MLHEQLYTKTLNTGSLVLHSNVFLDSKIKLIQVILEQLIHSDEIITVQHLP